MPSERSGQNFQIKRFAFEYLFERRDAIFFLRDTAATIGRIHKEDFHFFFFDITKN